MKHLDDPHSLAGRRDLVGPGSVHALWACDLRYPLLPEFPSPSEMRIDTHTPIRYPTELGEKGLLYIGE